MHEPRSILRFLFGRVRVVIDHHPPKYAPQPVRVQAWQAVRSMLGVAAKKSGLRSLGLLRPRIALRDGNDPSGHGPSSDDLADALDGERAGTRIDAAVVAGSAHVVRTRYRKVVNGVHLTGDHGHCLEVEVLVPAYFAKAPKLRRRASR